MHLEGAAAGFQSVKKRFSLDRSPALNDRRLDDQLLSSDTLVQVRNFLVCLGEVFEFSITNSVPRRAPLHRALSFHASNTTHLSILSSTNRQRPGKNSYLCERAKHRWLFFERLSGG